MSRSERGSPTALTLLCAWASGLLRITTVFAVRRCQTLGMGAAAGDPGVIGRDNELDLARRALAERNVLVLGEPGIGKTTVWRAVADEMSGAGVRVLTASPAEAERDFSYAVLADLCEPCMDELHALPAPQCRALEQVLLLDDIEGSVDPHLVSVAVRNLFRRLSASGRMLLAIDDVQWADGASLAVLSFALRRTPGIGLLASARKGTRLSLPVEVTHVELAGLSSGATHHLIVQHLGHSLPRPTLLRLHDISKGNPFFALELARLSPEAGETLLPESLRALLADRLKTLPGTTRTALAKAALGGVWAGDFAAAIDAGLVSGTPLRFTHPLYAEAAVEEIGESERRRLHQELAAEADTATQRAHHLALAVVGPDAGVAAHLDDAARDSTRQGALLAAARLWRSAADLTPPTNELQRSERMAEHGIALLLSGSPDEANEVLTAHLPELPNGPLRHRGRIHQALFLARTDSRAVIPVLEDVLSEVSDPHVRHEVIALLAAFHTTIGHGEAATALVRDHLAWAEDQAPDVLASALLLASGRATLDDRPPWELIERAARLAQADADQPRPAWGWATRAPALMREDRWDEARIAVDETGQHELRATVYQEAARTLSLAMIEQALGDARSAYDRADEILCIGEQINAPYLRCQGHIALAEAAILLGDLATANHHTSAALQLARDVYAELYVNDAQSCVGLMHLTTGDLVSAAATYELVTDDGYRHFGTHAGGRFQLDAVEAMTLAGSLERAEWIATNIPRDAWEYDVAQAMLVATRGDLGSALSSLQAGRRPRSPFRQGRNLLLAGRWQRMLRQRAAARESLLAARALFESIGAPLWLERADDELGRLGGRRPSGVTLTESERRVAELVAAGLSNKEVAARLVVSQRTVEVHLTKIYTKLEVPGRTALVARWPVS